MLIYSKFKNIYYLIISFSKMRRANRGMFMLAEKDLESVSNSNNSTVQEKKKPLLLRQLENQLRHLDEIDIDDFNNNNADPYLNDHTLDRLQTIAKEAARYDLKQIEKLSKLAIGKRILNIELKKKKDQHNTKLKKKEKIELFFRENRIKRYNYDLLIQGKLKQSTLIAKAYQNGKGFIESTSQYQKDYETALNECNYLGTIKEVNRLFYCNYSSMNKKQTKMTDILLKGVWIPIFLFICLAVTLPFKSFPYQEVVLMTLLAIIISILLLVSVHTFCDKPNNNNQIQQTIQDVQNYFERLNQKFQEKNMNIEWNCSKDFMYLEVIFHNGFPTSIPPQ